MFNIGRLQTVKSCFRVRVFLCTSFHPHNALYPLWKFNGHERNMRQRHLIAGITELIVRTSIVGPTGVSTCGSYTDTLLYDRYDLCSEH